MSDKQRPSQAGSRWILPDPSAPREVIIAGDGNVEALIQSVQGSVDAPNALGFLFGKKPTTEKVIQYVDAYKQKVPALHRRMYILHVGLTDILRHDRGQIAQTLSRDWKDDSASLTVCSIPEITTRGAEVLAAVRLANIQLQKWCKRSRHRFIDLRKGWNAEMMTKNGTHYSLVGLKFVADKISAEAATFLGHRHRRTQSHPKVQKSQERRHQRPHPKDRSSQTDAPTDRLQCPPTQAQTPQEPMKVPPPPWMHPPAVLPWSIQPVPPAMYHSVGELVKHHLMLATQMPR
ncbi:hypothetical protein MTO96_003518 [Rhipicephalus appendiculatus]